MSDDPVNAEIWAVLTTPLTGDQLVDLGNLVRDAVFAVIAACPDETADPVTRNWLERAKYLGLYAGPTEGPIDAMIDWLEGLPTENGT